MCGMHDFLPPKVPKAHQDFLIVFANGLLFLADKDTIRLQLIFAEGFIKKMSDEGGFS